VPNPLNVDCKVVSKKGEEMRVVVPADKYPAVPNPLTVLFKLLASDKLLMKLRVPSPTTVDVSSMGSM
jgi:predicted RNA-binding protein with PUA domain